MEKGVVSKTLDYAYDDWCVSQLALALGKKKEGKALLARSMNYKNVFHPEKKFVMRRDSLGNWDRISMCSPIRDSLKATAGNTPGTCRTIFPDW